MSALITMLGTGSAMPSASYNTCFVIDTPDLRLMVDAGGGNGIFKAMTNAGIDVGSIHHFFITHSHTDHILGAVWLVRRIVQFAMEGSYEGRLTVYGNRDVLDALNVICRHTYLESYYAAMLEVIEFVEVAAGSRFNFDDTELEFIDCHSLNVAQTGFRMTLSEGTTIACLGDEALTKHNMVEVTGTDVLMCGAFCRYADRDIFKPYEKHHHTVRDVAQCASEASVSTLILYHCEDRNMPSRAELYAAEASEFFDGKVIVPYDGERIEIC